jgi:hypothetical protein
MPWVREFLILSGDHASLTTGHNFHGVKTVRDRVRPLAVTDPPPQKLPAEGVSRVFEDLEPILLTERVDARHVTALPREMHRNEHFGQHPLLLRLGQLGLQVIWTHQRRVGIHIDKAHLGPAVPPGVGRCHKRDRTRP